jgi:hypothetical protein
MMPVVVVSVSRIWVFRDRQPQHAGEITSMSILCQEKNKQFLDKIGQARITRNPGTFLLQ